MHHPSIIFHNCRIFDGNSFLSPNNSALAIKGGIIEALGSDTDIVALAGPNTRMINGEGKLLLPGLIDSHTHLSMYAARKLQVDLSGCASLQEALKAIRTGVERSAAGEWVVGYGWDKNLWGDEYPTRQMLDEISTRHFISMQSKDWHSLWVNTPVLAVCGIDATMRDPAGGTILRQADGREPNGILQENACTIVLKQIAPIPLEQLYPALKKTFEECHEFGITAIHSVETNYDFANYSRLYSQGRLGLRIFFYFPAMHLKDNSFSDFAKESGNSFLKICGAKLFMDGTLGSQTADMLQPLEGLDHKGVAVLTEVQLAEYLALAVEQGHSCAIHAIGDAANRKTLDGFAAVREESKRKGLRHRIEHAQILNPADIARFTELDIIASVQPIHLAADIPLIERYLGERSRFTYAFSSLHRSGAMLAFGSDTPVESFDPWKALYTAIKRKYLCNPDAESLFAAEGVTLEEGLKAYTANSAYTVFEEDRLGMLNTGMLADVVLLNTSLFDESAESLLATKPLLTLQNGRVVYDAL